MASAVAPSTTSALPEVPAKHNDFISYVAAHPDTPMKDLIEPYKQYDSRIREVFAQDPGNPVLSDRHLNITPVFAGHEADLKIRARNLTAETEEEKDRYLIQLEDHERKPSGVPAVVQSFKDFQTNFNLFSESSLSDMDWSNVVAAGSSVVTPLLPVPKKYASSKRGLRQYYHEIIAPASDVDLFIYGLNEEEAIEKIKQIERCVKDSILEETTTVRTKHAITIASHYPIRHVQIVLRIYKSIAEILTGFDVDCACAAYDGSQVYASPRALAAYMTQINTIDLTRRSPSYENRLSKYSHRGFEIYWPHLDRSRIDPTIFERNFGRTLGLARLLVLEKLPQSTDRDNYMDQRRRERGRPAINRYTRFTRQLRGNIKDRYDHITVTVANCKRKRYEDEVADWVESDEVADYHTFTIPYGEKFHARKIEKLLYTKDLLLNAEWNKPEDREVNLHRHPAFFGNVDDVIYDCCGYCPKPETPEEEEVAEQESKIYVSGSISFIKDDPGRQTIGSFNPLTDDDWTEMAYVGNTARLCQAIVDEDLEHVQDWLAQEGADPNCRDYTGRTPLHLACMSSTPAIVQALVDAGARMVARVADGRTALHLAAMRGDVEIVKILMKKSEENEDVEAKKEELRKQARIAAKKSGQGAETAKGPDDVEMDSSQEDAEMIDADEDEDIDMKSATTGSFVKVKKEDEKDKSENLPEDEDEEEPDIFDVNVLAWDTPCSPLHLAVVNGHCGVVKALVQDFGADLLLPVKLLNDYNKSPRAAILTLVLALRLPLEKAKEMTSVLLKLGASSAQADLNQVTALHRFTTQEADLVQILLDHDAPAAKRAINHVTIGNSPYSPSVSHPLGSAIEAQNAHVAIQLLNMGANPEISFQQFMDAYIALHEQYARNDTDQNKQNYRQSADQPVLKAVSTEMPNVVLQLLQRGADPNTLNVDGWNRVLRNWSSGNGKSLLDVVQDKLVELRKYDDKVELTPPKPDFEGDGQNYITAFKDDSYQQWVAVKVVQAAKRNHKNAMKSHEERVEQVETRVGLQEKRQAIEQLIKGFEEVEKELLDRGAKAFYDLYPEHKPENNGLQWNNNPYVKKEEPWEVKFDFRVPDLTDKKREGYLKLFEAAWSGNLLAIKRLTLTFWGELRDQFPLKISIADSDNFTPFHIAILRGHVACAKGILEITQAQYKPKNDNVKARYSMNQEEDDDDYESSSQASEASEDESEIKVFRQIVDDQFTIDNIGEVATQVRSHTTPLAMLNWSCNVPQVKIRGGGGPAVGLSSQLQAGKWQWSSAKNLIQYAIEKDDMDLLKNLLRWGAEYTAMHVKVSENDDSPVRFYAVSEDDLSYATARGRISCAAELIKQTGVGVPLETLVKKSGVEIKEKPRYYQGLSIHGKKRADWAAAGREATPQRVTDHHPPLLHAAKQGNIESVEWFLSDAPARCYNEFAEKNKEDKRLKNLEKAKGGIQRAILNWLELRQNIALHCAVLADWKGEETQKLIDYLIHAMPKSLETKTSTLGQTPLHLAFALGRHITAKQLIDAGADQTCRSVTGENIVHALLTTRRQYKPVQVIKMLSLIDKRLIPSLFTERCSSGGSGASTPLDTWLADWMADDDENAEVLSHLLWLSPKLEELEMVNGAGDTPLHVLVKKQMPRLITIVLDKRPDLLYRENATGRTPAEMAWDMWMGECFADPIELPRNPNYSYWGGDNFGRRIVNEPADKFLLPKEKADEKEEDSGKSMNQRIWNLVRKRMDQDGAKGTAKRKLVSLGEANEVARRLAKRQKGGRSNWRRYRAESEQGDVEGEVEEDKQDEVAAWCYSAPAWCEKDRETEGSRKRQRESDEDED